MVSSGSQEMLRVSNAYNTVTSTEGDRGEELGNL